MAILIIFGIVLYFVIGAVIVGLFDLDWLEFEMYLAWPIIVPIILVILGCTWISDNVSMWIRRVKDRRENVNRKE